MIFFCQKKLFLCCFFLRTQSLFVANLRILFILQANNVTEEDFRTFFEVPPSSSIPEREWMCDNLATFSENYKSVHGYICLVICIFGAIANLLNIIVLTRKEMNGSPINRILTGDKKRLSKTNDLWP